MTLISRFKKNPFIIVMAVMIAYVAFAFYADIGNLHRTSLRINYLAIPLVIAPMTGTILLLALRFHLLLKALGINIAIQKSILIYIAGLSLAVTPGSSGQIIKSQIMKKHYDHAISKTSPIILVEKWNELWAALLILIIFVITDWMLESILIIILGSAIATFLFVIMRYHTFLNSFKKIISRVSRLRMFEESIEKSQGTMKALSSRKLLVEEIIITLPAMVLQAFSVYFAFNAVGVKIGLILSTQIFYVSLISGILSFLPGGLGVTEGSMAALLIKYYDHNIALIAGAVLFARLVTLWYPTLLGVIISQFVMKVQTIKQE